MSVAGLKRTIRRGLGLAAPAIWRFRPKNSLVILTYHRVLPKDHPDRLIEQPGMYVSPQTLAMHLRVLKEHFEIVDLSEWIARRRDGKPLPERACSITFDDGWRDNYDYGFPILQQADVPATIFLVADFIGTNHEFWPNRLARLLAGNDGSGFGALPLELRRLLGRLEVRPPSAGRAFSVAYVDQVIGACKAVPDETMNRILEVSSSDTLGEAPRSARALLDLSELREMGMGGRIRFGSHSRRHLRLIESLSSDKLKEEVIESREMLRQLTGQEVDVFCYPNGDYSPAALAVVRGEYMAAVTTQSAWTHPSTDLHLLPRIAVHDDIAEDANSFLARISGSC